MIAFADVPWVRLGLAAAALAAAALGGWYFEHLRLGVQIADMTREAETALREATETARETEKLGRLARDRSLDRAHSDLQAADRSAATAHAAAQQLRDSYIRLSAEPSATGSGALTAGQDAAGPGLVPPDMRRGPVADVAASLAELAGAGADLVASLARARVANEQCQREHVIAVSISRGDVTP